MLVQLEHPGNQQKEESSQHLYASQQKEEVIQVTAMLNVRVTACAGQATVDVAIVERVEPDVGGTQAGDDGGANKTADSGEEIKEAHDDSLHGPRSHRHSKLQTCANVGHMSECKSE